jgi:hypothetical protein
MHMLLTLLLQYFARHAKPRATIFLLFCSLFGK